VSTRAIIQFAHDRTDASVAAMIYRHGDGYPDGAHGVLCDLQRFFVAVEHDTSDTRFEDPAYLAAKFVVWTTQEMRSIILASRVRHAWDRPEKPEKTGQLDFMSCGIVRSGDVGEEYTYRVNCGALDKKGRPTVEWSEMVDYDGAGTYQPNTFKLGKLDKQAKAAVAAYVRVDEDMALVMHDAMLELLQDLTGKGDITVLRARAETILRGAMRRAS
jgi:hypothetical protein